MSRSSPCDFKPIWKPFYNADWSGNDQWVPSPPYSLLPFQCFTNLADLHTVGRRACSEKHFEHTTENTFFGVLKLSFPVSVAKYRSKPKLSVFYTSRNSIFKVVLWTCHREVSHMWGHLSPSPDRRPVTAWTLLTGFPRLVFMSDNGWNKRCITSCLIWLNSWTPMGTWCCFTIKAPKDWAKIAFWLQSTLNTHEKVQVGK